jgi:hypothetical protein
VSTGPLDVESETLINSPEVLLKYPNPFASEEVTGPMIDLLIQKLYYTKQEI